MPGMSSSPLAALLSFAVLLPFTPLPGQVSSPAGEAGAQEPFDLERAFAAAVAPDEEARWTLVPWRSSLTEALAESRGSDTPVYLYVNDGEVESGRC
jgi:hypothetical protein